MMVDFLASKKRPMALSPGDLVFSPQYPLFTSPASFIDNQQASGEPDSPHP
jgi:hypothetical protein